MPMIGTGATDAGILRTAAQAAAAQPQQQPVIPPPQYQGFNPALLQGIPPELLNRFGNYQMAAYNPAMQAQGLLQSLGQLQLAPTLITGATGAPIQPPAVAQQRPGLLQVPAGGSRGGDAMGRTGGINPPAASPGMLNFMHNTLGKVPGIGAAARGLANMGGYRGGGGGYASGDKKATEAHDRSRQGAGV